MKCPDCFPLAPNRVWRTYLGGKTLDEISAFPTPADSHFPEDWLLSTTRASNVGRDAFPDEGISQLRVGNETLSLIEIAERFPQELFGSKHLERFGKSAGFLLKFLDSSIRLHMQCHPSIPFARKYLNFNAGKTEGYYILGVRPGCEGYIYLGFQRPVEQQKFKEAILQQNIPEILASFEKIPVKPGDCFLVPGGIPHAIGEGVFMVEMMEPTDFAVRIEFERGGYVLPESARFMNRGIDFALSMFDFTARSVEETRRTFFIKPRPLPLAGDGKHESLFEPRITECFRAEQIAVTGKAEVEHDSFRVLIVTEGEGRLHAGAMELPLKQYDRILIPYQTPRIHLKGEMELLLALPPSVKRR